MQCLIPRVQKPTERPGRLSVTACNSHASDKKSELPQQHWVICHQGNLTAALQTEGLCIPDFAFTRYLQVV